MNKKNVAKIAIFLILLTCLIGAVNASEDVSTDTINAADDQTVTPETTHEDTQKEVVSEPTKPVSDDTPKEEKKETKAKLKTTNTETNNNTNDNEDTTKTSTTTTPKDDKKLKAQNKQEPLKSGTKTVEVNNYNELINEINTAITDSENDTYIINLKPGTYSLEEDTYLDPGTYKPNIIINANNQILSANNQFSINFWCDYNITINNATITHKLFNYGDHNLIILNNVTLNNEVKNGQTPSNPKANLKILNSTINFAITNREYLTINHSTINKSIQNDGRLTLSDDNTFDENVYINGAGSVIANDMDKLVPYLTQLNGTYTIENRDIKVTLTNYGNLTIRNSTIKKDMNNYGNLTIGDDVKFDNSITISGNGKIIINNMNRIAPYLQVLNGNYIIENITITKQRTNNGNLTFRNVTISARFINNGNLTLENTTINQEINNEGILNISDDITFSSSAIISGNGKIITDNPNAIFLYLSTCNGDYLIENVTIGSGKTNNGNLTIRNSTINGIITNNGNLTIENSTIKRELSNTGNLTIRNSLTKMGNAKITNKGKLIIENMTINTVIQNQNNGILIIGDDVTFGTKFQVTGTGGTVIINDYNKIFKYLSEFRGEATVNLGDYNTQIKNYGNLTIENTTFNAIVYNFANGQMVIKNSTTKAAVYNYATMEFYNSTLNSTITNNGVLIISEDSIIGSNFKLTGTGQVITNNTQLIDYVDIYKGNIDLTNKTISTPKTNKGNLTLTNCTINSTINNDGRIIIDENTVFGENAKITGPGEIVTNDLNKILPIIDTINGKYEINDTTLTKNYAFRGQITLNNCTITNPDNTNFGTLNLKNCTVDVGADNTFLTNYGTVTISKDTKITGKIMPDEDRVFYEGMPKTYNINSESIDLYFDETGLNSIIRPGDILNFQGNIVLTHNLIIDTPVNINSENAYINGNQLYNFTITEDGTYTNITGISFNNTKILINAKQVTLENTNINGTIKLDGSNNTIINNKIITTDEYTITSTKGQNNTITNNYLVSQNLIGDKTVNLPDTTNIIKDNVPFNLKIEITVNPENTVNKTATIIIVLKDDNDNLIPNQKVNVTIGSKTQEADLKNGFLVYTYTPENIGEDTINIKYAGDNTYLPTTNTTTINITANKDQIIEELNQEILDKNETIQNQDNTIQTQKQELTDKNETITALNNTVKAQDTTIKTQTETIQNQDNTIQTQKQEINTANNKLATAEQQASQATVPIKTVKAAKTVKKSKKYTIKVTLKKAVKGKKVFVIFNGKTYTKKTNKKGIATITIPKSALKKLGGKKIKYQIISGEKIVKKSVKVKK